MMDMSERLGGGQMPFGWVGGLTVDDLLAAPDYHLPDYGWLGPIHSEKHRLDRERGDIVRRDHGLRLADAAERLEGWFFWVPSEINVVQFYALDRAVQKQAKRVSHPDAYIQAFKGTQRNQRFRMETLGASDAALMRAEAEDEIELAKLSRRSVLTRQQMAQMNMPPIKKDFLVQGGHLEVERNSFVAWVMGKTDKMPSMTSSMNCWEAVLFAACRADIITRGWLEKTFRAALIDPTQWVNRLFHGDKAFDFDPPNGLIPIRGDILIWDGGEHVAICLGQQGRDIMTMTHWAPYRLRIPEPGHHEARVSRVARHFHCEALVEPEPLKRLRFIPCPLGLRY
jgi:hypothetical protein